LLFSVKIEEQRCEKI